MKRAILYCIIAISLFGCKSDSPNSINNELIQYSEILMKCMDLVSIGGKMEVVIQNQAEYDSLIDVRFQKPLDDYWEANYDTTLYYVRLNNPGLSDSEYTVLVKDRFYSVLPFRGTENCMHPNIDFTQYTLLGLDAEAGGCEHPDYNIFISKNDSKKEIVYNIVILEHGSCLMGFWRNKWVLIPKIPESYRVIFQKEYVHAL